MAGVTHPVLALDYVDRSHGTKIRYDVSGNRRSKAPSPLERFHFDLNSPAVEHQALKLIKLHYEAYLAHVKLFRQKGLSQEILRCPITHFMLYFLTPYHRGMTLIAHYGSLPSFLSVSQE